LTMPFFANGICKAMYYNQIILQEKEILVTGFVYTIN
jgi:hypothetical protein